ncbi:hypothetical protein [Nocardioides jensenii]|uniref:hypothetical protein n=1 Tax=Nocardioides jensenii TaxID=1843 RepID=UPI0008325C8A|nr:hypothetical protein [Nocardioides jensenii]
MNTHIPRRSGAGARQVLTPGKRKAARHPWANMLHEARTGGVTIRAIGDNYEHVNCHGCGAGFGIGGGSEPWTGEDREAQQYHEEETRRHMSGECKASRS